MVLKPMHPVLDAEREAHRLVFERQAEVYVDADGMTVKRYPMAYSVAKMPVTVRPRGRK